MIPPSSDPRLYRAERAYLSLEGLSCGDALGECFFALPFAEMQRLVETRTAPGGRWKLTDDTLMAISIYKILCTHGRLDQSHLASHFAELYDPDRGYGAAMHRLLLRIRRGAPWQQESASLFDGHGSYGNGAAMRVAPLGAYFADDLNAVVDHARRSAIVTHAHAEGVAGAVAVAIGTALAWQSRADQPPQGDDFLRAVREFVPASKVRDGIDEAISLKGSATIQQAALALGNGSQVTAMDTVPFVLWSAARHIASYEEALWQTVSAWGDMDTTCAMVGGIVVMRTGLEGIPVEWRKRREPLLTILRSLIGDR